MKKLMSVLACALCAAFVLAGDYFPLSITVPAGTTAVTNTIDMAKIGAAKIDTIAFVTTGANTGGVQFAEMSLGYPNVLDSTLVTSTNTVYNRRPSWSENILANMTNQLYTARKVRVIVSQQSNGAAQKWDFGVFTE